MFKICSLKHAHSQKASDTEHCIEMHITQLEPLLTKQCIKHQEKQTREN